MITSAKIVTSKVRRQVQRKFYENRSLGLDGLYANEMIDQLEKAMGNTRSEADCLKIVYACAVMWAIPGGKNMTNEIVISAMWEVE